MDYYSGQQLDNMSVYQLLVADYYTGVFTHMDFQRNTRAHLVVTYRFQGVYAYCLEDSKTKVKEWFVEHEGALGSGMLLPDIREVA